MHIQFCIGKLKTGKHLSITEATSILSEGPLPASLCPFHEAVGAKTASPFVSISKFVVANDKIAEVKDAFRHRPHLVDEQPGFVQMEVFSPFDQPEEIWLVTYWTDAESFRLWHHSHLYQQSHKGIPKGLKLVPGERRFGTSNTFAHNMKGFSSLEESSQASAAGV